MANSLLTVQQITREALRVLHQKLTFIGSINRQYDSQYAKEGAKIGSDLKIRLPNQYTVTNGAVMSAQETDEQSTSLSVSTQKHVGINFSTAELTLTLDDFSSRILEPAMAVLAASMEADAYSMYKDVYQIVDSDAVALAFSDILKGRKALNDALAPMDNNRTALLSTTHAVKIVDALKTLQEDSGSLSKQYREGRMYRAAGFDFSESTHANDHTTGTAAKTTGYVMNTSTGLTSGSGTLTISGGSTTFLKGDVITIADVYRVHPETKVSTGALQQFVVTADSGASATSLSVSPAPVTSGARQNVSLTSPGASKALVKVGAGANELLNSSMAYHRDAFAFASADLVMPKGIDFAAREVYDGISMRIVRQYDIVNDKLPCRVDVLYGYKAIRPQLACRIHADG